MFRSDIYGVSSLPMKYLGLLLWSTSKALSIWDTVIEKIECRLVEWKRFYLSKCGKITLIKSDVSNLHTYFFSLFSIQLVWRPTLKNFSVSSIGVGVWSNIRQGGGIFSQHTIDLC